MRQRVGTGARSLAHRGIWVGDEKASCGEVRWAAPAEEAKTNPAR